MAPGQNMCNIINKYIQQNITVANRRYLQFVKKKKMFPPGTTNLNSMRGRRSGFLLCMCHVFCCWVYTVMVTTPNPRSVAKPETFHSLSLTTGLDYRLFNGPSARSVWWSRPRGDSNHSEHPERLSSRGVLKAAGGKRETRGRVSLCARHVSDTERVPAFCRERRRWQTPPKRIHFSFFFYVGKRRRQCDVWHSDDRLDTNR